MQEVRIELGIGESVQIGESVYTVIDIDRGEVYFRVDPADEFAWETSETVPPGK